MASRTQALSVTPLDSPVGAIVEGWVPKAELTVSIKAEIVQALQAHQVLIFRGQVAPEDQALVRFASEFGDLVQGSEWFGDIDRIPEILRVNNLIDDKGVPEGTGGSMSLEWHSDYSYVPTVGKESFLEAVELPAQPPSTSFCSQYAALESLPRAMVDMLRGYSAHHSITGYYAGEAKVSDSPESESEAREGFAAKRTRNQSLGRTQPDIPQATHPVILRHPDTGRELLYVSRGITRRIVDLPKDESDALLKELAAHSTRTENVYAHKWQAGDLVMFDTLGTLHRREAWDPSERRVMRQLSTWWRPPGLSPAGQTHTDQLHGAVNP
ncbi:MAG: TauD/TfdA family dioxygenase [Proteobacteria bacterium]|nr:TauD/TfdA family dioxygenase [Pseudomonadota bacterium]